MEFCFCFILYLFYLLRTMKNKKKNRVLNDNYLNKMKEISVVLLVQVVLYKFKGDCSF